MLLSNCFFACSPRHPSLQAAGQVFEQEHGQTLHPIAHEQEPEGFLGLKIAHYHFTLLRFHLQIKIPFLYLVHFRNFDHFQTFTCLEIFVSNNSFFLFSQEKSKARSTRQLKSTRKSNTSPQHMADINCTTTVSCTTAISHRARRRIGVARRTVVSSVQLGSSEL